MYKGESLCVVDNCNVIEPVSFLSRVKQPSRFPLSRCPVKVDVGAIDQTDNRRN